MRSKRLWIVLTTCLCLLAALLLGLAYFRVISFNTPSRSDYPVRGVDVSHYQGKIDWAVLASQDIDFAFIKATEGSEYVDPDFIENWEKARATHLLVGAYHFFSFDSTAAEQAENFINTVPNDQPMLPPVVDVEFYAIYAQTPPEQEIVCRELDELLAILEAHYHVKPILYSTQTAYSLYIAGHYSHHVIWIRDVYFTPTLPDGRTWDFWQYSDRGRLEGFAGEEKYIDLNVFFGSLEQLNDLLTK